MKNNQIPKFGTRSLTNNSSFLPLLELVSRQGYSTGFTILMEHSSGNGASKDYSIHPRFAQPCQGGDMRKYESSHPGRCTQPHNGRPTDLYNPFPAGKPSALAIHTWLNRGSEATDLVVEAVMSDESPWRSGFGGRSNVIEYRDENGHIEGFILKNLDVDPTVLVNGLGILNTISHQNFPTLTSAGLTPNEALAFLMLNGMGGILTSVVQTYAYRFPPVFSPRRFFDRRPNDLSGGLYSAGADYNRTYVQDVFLGDKEKGGIVWQTEMNRLLSGKTVTKGTLIEAAKILFKESYEKETPLTPEDTEYKYRDAMAEEKPFPDYAIQVNPKLKATEVEVVKPKREKAA